MTAFNEDEAQGKLLGKLRLWLADVEEGTAAQRAEWKEEKTQLEERQKQLEADKRECRQQVEELQRALMAATAIQPGNDFVTQVLET